MVLLLAVTAGEASAQWKWRDKEGRVTASDRPPPSDVPDKDILTRPAAPPQRAAPAATPAAPAGAAGPQAAASAPRTALEREVEARKRAADQEAAAKIKAEEARNAERRAENCRRARSMAAALDSGQRVRRTNERGEPEFLDDNQRAAEARRAREVIESDCR